ncbi:MAG: MBL fold metallo-hydrolase [Clostridiales bacterium]|nr:MBL fold metallo-hydrolase [Clostridiales bacterium]
MENQITSVKSRLKSKELNCKDKSDPRSAAYIKMLRESNKTLIMHDVNPYAEVYQFRENLYAIYTDSADGAGAPWMFVVDGPKKAMIIDTGFGIGNIKGLVDEITGGKKIYAVNTHGHVDHAYGNCQFDAVYCHEYETPILKAQNKHIWDYLFDENGKGKWLDFDRNDIQPFKSYEIVGCDDGYIFNLGDGYEVELVWLPGHTQGHAAYLDKKNRILFAGDGAVSSGTGIAGGKSLSTPRKEFATITAYRNALAKIIERIEEIDHIFPAHAILDVESQILPNILEAANAIITAPENYDYSNARTRVDGSVKIELFKHVKGYGPLAYTMDTV